MSVDVIAARREARRRKILENSERRLQQISSGLESKEIDTEREDNEHKLNGSLKTCATTHCGSSLPNGLIMGAIIPEDDGEQEACMQLEECLKLFTSRGGATAAGDDDSEQPDFMLNRSVKSNFSLSGELSNAQRIPQSQSSGYQKWLHHVLLIFFAATTRILFALHLGHFIGTSLLVPFITLVVLRLSLTYRSMSVAPSGMFGAVLLLSGISPRKLTIIATFFNIVTTVFEDFALYMFTFVIVHSLFSTSSSTSLSESNPS